MTKKNSFEATLERLEKVVSWLESGKLSLDESLKSFETGVEYYKECKKKLMDVEKKITKLSERLDD